MMLSDPIHWSAIAHVFNIRNGYDHLRYFAAQRITRPAPPGHWTFCPLTAIPVGLRSKPRPLQAGMLPTAVPRSAAPTIATSPSGWEVVARPRRHVAGLYATGANCRRALDRTLGRAGSAGRGPRPVCGCMSRSMGPSPAQHPRTDPRPGGGRAERPRTLGGLLGLAGAAVAGRPAAGRWTRWPGPGDGDDPGGLAVGATAAPRSEATDLAHPGHLARDRSAACVRHDRAGADDTPALHGRRCARLCSIWALGLPALDRLRGECRLPLILALAGAGLFVIGFYPATRWSAAAHASAIRSSTWA